jgi:Fur family ferric uptake transcriptional regulator
MEADDYPDVSEIYRRVTAIDPGISQSTIYRTLKLLSGHTVLQLSSS